LVSLNKSEDFSLWKANVRGVDLNVNFDAAWGKGAKNLRRPGAENYIGKRPFSERESRAIRQFTLRVAPDYTVSYHTKGEEIYWRFPYVTYTCPYEKDLADSLSRTTGYPLKVAENSVGGYKDWCLQTLRIPAFTVEVGKDTIRHPLDERALPHIIEKNKYALYMLSKEFCCHETNDT
jgi:g-D-glutamyl-meso-diaminopimelate peptidase